MPSIVAGATQTRPSSWSARTSRALAAFRSPSRADVAERDDRERRRPAERLEAVVGDDEVVEQPRLPQVVLDRVAERLRAVGPEGEPELEGPERARVLERDVDHVAACARAGCTPPRARTPGRGRRGGARAGRRRPSAGRATCARRASPSRPGRGRRRGGRPTAWSRRGARRRRRRAARRRPRRTRRRARRSGRRRRSASCPRSRRRRPGRARRRGRRGSPPRPPRARAAGSRRSAATRTLPEPIPRISAARSIE